MVTLKASRRFLRDYRKASAVMAHQAQQEVGVLMRRIRELPDWADCYDRVAALNRNDVLEVKLGHRDRMTIHAAEEVTLLRMGPHAVVPRMALVDVDAMLDGVVDPPPGLLSPPFPPRSAGGGLTPSVRECSDDWIFSLDEQQEDVALTIWGQLVDDLSRDLPSAHLIAGGPGTGKTVVLLWLLKALGDEGWAEGPRGGVGLAASKEMTAFIEAGTGWDLSAVRRDPARDVAEVLFIDDPASLAQVRTAVERMRAENAFGAVVVGMDPFQVDHALTDETFFGWAADNAVQMHSHTVCYRQKENVGRAAAAVMGLASGRTTNQRYRERLRAIADEITYVNPTGIVRSLDAPTLSDVESIAAFLGDQRWTFWTYWPPVLLAVERGCDLPAEWEQVLTEAVNRDAPPGTSYIQKVDLEDVASVRGLEFQHVVMVISEGSAEAARYLTGRNMAELDRLRLLRIPYSRAKDSLHALVVPAGT